MDYPIERSSIKYLKSIPLAKIRIERLFFIVSIYHRLAKTPRDSYQKSHLCQMAKNKKHGKGERLKTKPNPIITMLRGGKQITKTGQRDC